MKPVFTCSVLWRILKEGEFPLYDIYVLYCMLMNCGIEEQFVHYITCSKTLYLSCRFYREVKELADNRLTDGTGRKPHYRSLLILLLLCNI